MTSRQRNRQEAVDTEMAIRWVFLTGLLMHYICLTVTRSEDIG